MATGWAAILGVVAFALAIALWLTVGGLARLLLTGPVERLPNLAART